MSRSCAVVTFWTAMLLAAQSLAADENDDRVRPSPSYLFRTTEDFYEQENIYGYPEYDSIVNYVKELAADWSDKVATPEIPDTTDKITAWNASKTVTNWLTTDFVSREVEQKYHNKDAPHIVFVLVDDWGWNDVGFRSTYMDWTTPNIDRLSQEGVLLANYYSLYLCTPSRASLLTGRYAFRSGMHESGDSAELPLKEFTLAQEMKSAGYRTYMVGKWHLGMSTMQHTPPQRGFDYYYGYWNGFTDYWTKSAFDYLDLHENNDIVTDATELDNTYHNGHLLNKKAEEVIFSHAETHEDQPMFLYYAMQLIHGKWSAPTSYLNRCGVSEDESVDDYTRTVEYNYCALNVMLDEAVANITCALQKAGMSDNTIMIIASDNGGEANMPGNSYPFRGQKGSYFNGGMMATALVHSNLLPTESWGTTYEGLMHVTDWMPTLMGLATNNEWDGSYIGNDLDGYDMWSYITSGGGSNSPRDEIIHYHDGADTYTITAKGFKFSLGSDPPGVVEPSWIFDKDQDPGAAADSCDNPSLMHSSYGGNTLMMADKPTSSSSSHTTYSKAAQETVSNGKWSSKGLAMTFFFAVVGTICMIILLRVTWERKRKYDQMRAAHLMAERQELGETTRLI